MKKIVFLCLAVVLATVSGGMPVSAQEVMSKLVMKAGDRVWLFHSGTPDVLKAICVGEVIPVYREVKTGKIYEVREVGKVRVLEREGNNYFQAEVVNGSVRVGDTATKDAASCLLQLPGTGRSGTE